MKKYIFNLLTAVAAVMVLASPVAGKDITQSVPAIYDKAIAEAQKQNAIVDTIDVMSTKMGRVIRNTVVLPAQYSQKKNPTRFFPVVYLLHGAQGSYRDWPKKADLRSLATQYAVIIVCPDGQDSWYFDSPIDPNFQFETYVTKELRSYIETHYRTINHPKYRAITGLSMGGHGALWLGDFESNKEVWREHSVISLVPTLEPGQNIVIDAGKNDIFINDNNALHALLDEYGIPHDYTVRPGKHSWSFWVNALDYQMLFFFKAFNSGVNR